jgi:hypothetical protein
MADFAPTDRISRQYLRTGQPRAYADSFYEARILWEWRGTNDKGDWQPRPIAESVAKEMLVPLVKAGVQPAGEGNWASPRLRECVQEAPGQWRILVVSPYTD